MAVNRPLYNGQSINFTVSFTASTDQADYTTYVVKDTLAAGLSYTTATVTANGTSLTPTTDYSVATQTVSGQEVVTITINNNNNVAGNAIIATIDSTVSDMTQIVSAELTNTATVTVNGTTGLDQASNTVTVDFETFQSAVITNTTTPNNRVINAIINNLVEFNGTFTAPNYSDPYGVIITMQLPSGTVLSSANSSVLYGSSTPTDVGGTWSTLTGNIAQYSFTNSATIKNQPISIVLNTSITDNKAIESSFDSIFNLAIGGNPATSSNTITTIFVKPVNTVTKAVVDYVG